MEEEKNSNEAQEQETIFEVLILHEMTYVLDSIEHALILKECLTQPTRLILVE